MPDRHRLAASVGALLLTLCGAAAPAGACGFDGALSGNFGVLHPKSLSVAFAIRDSIEAGAVDQPASEPIAPGAAGYWRAVGHLNSFQRVLSAFAGNADRTTTAISVLFIDSNLWSRFSPGPRGFDLQVHTAGPEPGDITMVTSEAILKFALQGKMPVDELLARGLIAIDGEPATETIVRQLVKDGFARAALTADRSRTQPVRLFGPTR